jgi:hypothetical protein
MLTGNPNRDLKKSLGYCLKMIAKTGKNLKCATISINSGGILATV